MKLEVVKCPRCGESSLILKDTFYVCEVCGAHLTVDEYAKIKEGAEKLKKEQIDNFKKTIKDALNRKHSDLIDFDNLKVITTQIKGYDPENAFANFVYALSDYKLTNNYQAYERTLANLSDTILTLDEVKEIATLLLLFPDIEVRVAIEKFFMAQGVYNSYKEKLDAAFRAREIEKNKYIYYDKKVFICFSSREKNKAKEIADYIETKYNDILCWYSERNLEKASTDKSLYWERIKPAIEHCPVFLYLMSKDSLESKDCNEEIRHVLKHNPKAIRITYRLDNVEPDPETKVFTDGRNWIDGFEKDNYKDLAKLISSAIIEARNIRNNPIVVTKRDSRSQDYYQKLEQIDGLLEYRKSYEKAIQVIDEQLDIYPKDAVLWEYYLKAKLKGKQERNDEIMSIKKNLMRLTKDKNRIRQEYYFLFDDISEEEQKIYIGLGEKRPLGNYRNKELYWKTLYKKDGLSLVICDKIIEQFQYDEREDNNYSHSNLHYWLNHSFLLNSFDKDEQSQIVEMEVDNSRDSLYTNKANKYLCENTYDKIFLLSENDVEVYLSFEGSRIAFEEEGLPQSIDFDKENTQWWWLRSPDSSGKDEVKCIDQYGCLNRASSVFKLGVRPAMWVRFRD